MSNTLSLSRILAGGCSAPVYFSETPSSAVRDGVQKQQPAFDTIYNRLKAIEDDAVRTLQTHDARERLETVKFIKTPTEKLFLKTLVQLQDRLVFAYTPFTFRKGPLGLPFDEFDEPTKYRKDEGMKRVASAYRDWDRTVLEFDEAHKNCVRSPSAGERVSRSLVSGRNTDQDW